MASRGRYYNRFNTFSRVTITNLSCIILSSLILPTTSLHLKVTPARVVSQITYSPGTVGTTTASGSTTRPTLPPLTPPSNSSTTTTSSRIDPRDDVNRINDEEEVQDYIEELIAERVEEVLEERAEEFLEAYTEENVLVLGIVNPEINGDYTEENDTPRDKRQITACGCYAPAQCNNTGNTDGTGLIDFRIISGGNPTCSVGLEFCCPSNNSAQQSCGSRFTPSTSYPTTGGQARYGDYPWMVLIQNATDGAYVSGGILIDLNNVLTTAHRISKFTNGVGLRIRLGEWDMSATTEQFPYRDFGVNRVWVHESYNPGTLQNDVALIRLSSSVSFNPPAGITPICMPSTNQNFEGQRCWVSGWGADKLNGSIQTILRATDVPIVAPASCESALKQTRLGNAWTLDRSSFICAGGESNKDACTGDGGSGLVCEVSSGRWTLAGLVAWGIGCATQGVPAAYVNVVTYLPWIQTRLSQ